jgi:uroporphyrinogen decarboxylase
MEHKERVLHAIHHQQPDRVPMDYSARSEVDDALMHHLGVAGYDRLLECLDVDFRYIQPIELIYERDRYQGPPLRAFPDGVWEDIWGVRRKRVQVSTGVYDEVCYSPLSEATTVEDVAAHRWPEPDWFNCSDWPNNAGVTRGMHWLGEAGAPSSATLIGCKVWRLF